MSKKSFGGLQVGAGRPKLPPEQKKKQLTITIPPDCLEWIRSQFLRRGEINIYLEKLIRNQMKEKKEK
jgi:hypothetical protein